MNNTPQSPEPLATRIRQLRQAQGISLDELASRSKISKTYLWELEKDVEGEKRPSADVLMRIAAALSTTIAHLLSLPSVRIQGEDVEIPKSLREFTELAKQLGANLSADDVRDLARMQFRGSQPQTAEQWYALYSVLKTTRKPKP